MNSKDLNKIIKNCDSRIRAAKKLYKQGVKGRCIATQNRALSSIDFNEDLKSKCIKRLSE
jgi:hypothetical protein